jgi:hypothetical protein
MLDRWFESRLASLCRVVLCRYRPCDGLITRLRGPTVCRKLSWKQMQEDEITNAGPGPELDSKAMQEEQEER